MSPEFYYIHCLELIGTEHPSFPFNCISCSEPLTDEDDLLDREEMEAEKETRLAEEEDWGDDL